MPKNPAMPTCTPTTCPTPHHGKPGATTSNPPRHHSAGHQPMKVVQREGGSSRGGGY